ncbi:MAG: hypothetical protein DRP96_12445 [Candidatus Neomarinimicrobiota bacterium]|nr:MAG: hypothetical protein DRP96_12445 [Candidatus Neomarinimicrobiota bacterium]
MQETVLSQLHERLKPEFLNRVDEVVVFTPLLPSQINDIVQLQFNRLSKRIEHMGYQVSLSDEAREKIGKASWDPIYGARPVKRMIQKHILDPLAVEILSGKFKPGDKINVTVESGTIQFKKS